MRDDSVFCSYDVHAEGLFRCTQRDCSDACRGTVQMHSQELILFLPPEEMKQPQKRMSKAAFLSPFKYHIQDILKYNFSREQVSSKNFATKI
jgi:hypothetical protein